jgi:hypothetical protein
VRSEGECAGGLGCNAYVTTRYVSRAYNSVLTVLPTAGFIGIPAWCVGPVLTPQQIALLSRRGANTRARVDFLKKVFGGSV